ncbi:CU044_5270 family protein [Streptomyces sp. NPDC059720]|uniref:CU044_5270 family protein n=1 Tax=Streptomyces sp. NPDC059720 TaxID=3346924 RepID=UPI0036B8F389
MADELDLLRGADPVPADGSRFGDGPLDHRAERRLEELLCARPAERRRDRWLRLHGRVRPGGSRPAGTPPASPLTGGRPRWLPAPGRAPLAWGLLAAAVVTALTLTLILSGPATPPAVAAPRPLVVDTGSAALPLDRLAERASAAIGATGAPRLRKGTHVRSWSLGMSQDAPPVTLPEERLVRWRPDGSRTELVVATDPEHPGRPVLTDRGGAPRLVGDGHVLLDRSHPPSWSDAPPQSPPPRDPDRLRAYLTEAAFTGTPPTTPELLDAVATLLDHWTLGQRENAALARLLSGAEALRPAGQVTDRLGRRGQAYVTDARGVRRMLIMDPATGAVLGLESTLTAPDPRYGVRKGDVLSYSAWMR